MSDWTSGYVADIDYTFGYYTELNPLRAKLAFLNAGLACPEIGVACELGFGQGMSTNIHAAGSPISWYGTDFNPSHARFARELASVSGSGAKLYDDAFSDFAARADLPDFDYIGLHGIWSWISDENRGIIVDFIRRKLKVGGVLYISYNTLPGWSGFAPLRHLMRKHTELFGAEGNGIVNRIDNALAFTDRLIATNPLYLRANPLVADRFKKTKGANRNYLAHEFFNRDWHPMHFATLAELLEPAKVSYACSAHYINHLDAVNLTSEQASFLKEIPDTIFRETVRDFMVNQQFRRDYWVRGACKVSQLEKKDALRSMRVILTAHRSDISMKITVPLGEASMDQAIYTPILDVLDGSKPVTIGQLERAVKDKGVSFSRLMEAVMVLINFGYLALAQDDETISRTRTQTDKLNAYVLGKARDCSDFSYLASPVTGGGVNANRVVQLFLLAMSQGEQQPEQWARFVYRILEAQGHSLVQNGVRVVGEEESLKELTSQATLFVEKLLPVLRALQVAGA